MSNAETPLRSISALNADSSQAAAVTSSQAAGPAVHHPALKVSPKVTAGASAGVVSTAFWTIATATFWKHTFTPDALAVLVSSTTAIVGSAAAYFRTDPLRVPQRVSRESLQ